MTKKIKAVNPRTGQWEKAKQHGKPFKSGYGPNRETVVTVEFRDGQKIEQPTWATDEA